MPRIHQDKQSIIDHLMKINRYQSIPSIPSQTHAYGYTENENNDLELNKSPAAEQVAHTKDIPGPGQYEAKTAFDAKEFKGAAWHKSKVKRLEDTENKKDLQNLGPGIYEINVNMVPLYKLKPSPEFASKTVRTSDMRKGAVANEFIKERLAKSQENYNPGTIN